MISKYLWNKCRENQIFTHEILRTTFWYNLFGWEGSEKMSGSKKKFRGCKKKILGGVRIFQGVHEKKFRAKNILHPGPCPNVCIRPCYTRVPLIVFLFFFIVFLKSSLNAFSVGKKTMRGPPYLLLSSF